MTASPCQRLLSLSLGLGMLVPAGITFLPGVPGTQAIAQAQDPGPSKRPRQRLQADWIKDLNLTASQVERLQVLQDQFQRRRTEREQALRQAQAKLGRLIASNAPAPEIRSQHEEVKRSRQAMGDLAFEQVLAIREILTPEQRDRFISEMERRRSNKTIRLQP